MKSNNLGLALGMALKFYTSVTKRLKLNRKFSGLIPTFVEVTGEKLVGGTYGINPILNRVNTISPFCLNCTKSFGFLPVNEKSLGALELALKMKEIWPCIE